MVKLASSRESRTYGHRPARNRWEYINAGIYVFATLLLLAGLAAQLSPVRSPGLVLLLVALLLIAAVNAHDLLAHLAGVDFRLPLVGLDPQLALVEFAVPSVQLLGSILVFIAILFLLIETERGHGYRLVKHAWDMLIAGPALWVIGSILNVCQVYERADGRAQILQSAVQIPFLMGSLLFLVGGVFNRLEINGSIHHHFKILGRSWVWFCLFGSMLLLAGGLMNVAKVFMMQQMDGLRLEKLRGGAQERLGREREAKVPLILEDSRKRRRPGEEASPAPVPEATSYKDILVRGGSSEA